MIKNYRISVDGQFYAGEKECELNTWRVDPWSNNSFHTKNQKRNILVFEPRENNNFKIITGVVNLIGEIRKIIEFINYTGLMQGNEIIIEAEPYKVPLELNIDYYLSLESELSKQKQINQEMKKQLDIATDLGQKRFEKLTKIEKENKELCHDKENLMSAYLGNENMRLIIIDLLSRNYVVCDDCGGSGGVEVGENEIDSCAKCDGTGLVYKERNDHEF